jgi:hypothetical protein
MQLQLQALQMIKDMAENGTLGAIFSMYYRLQGETLDEYNNQVMWQQFKREEILTLIDLALTNVEPPLTEQEAHEFAFLTWNQWYDESSYHAGVKAGVEFAQRFHGIQPQ